MKLLLVEREMIIRYDGTADAAVIGSNIPFDVAKLTKLWGPAPDIRGEWHSWNVPKSQVRLPRPRAKAKAKSEARVAAGKRLAARQKAEKEAITAPPVGKNASDNAVK